MNLPGPGLYQRLILREERLFLALTIIVGIVAGLSAVLFSLAIEQTQRTFYGMEPSILRRAFLPALVSLVAGVLLSRYFKDVRGSGVPQTKVSYHLNQGRMATHVPFSKFLLGAFTIGAGHSMGREGPSVQIGAGLASLIGRWLRLSPHRVQSLVPVGAAAALGAAFNTPVAAVLFALEEIIGNLNAELLGSTVLASVASVVVARSILGNEPLFRVPVYELVHSSELFAYALLGILGGVLSLIFCKSLLRMREWFAQLPPKTVMFRPMLGGLAIGVIIIFVPEVMGVGYEHIDQALNGGLGLQALALLCLVKLVATVISYASGNAGGIFAPSLFLGAMAGGAMGIVVQQVGLFPSGDPGAYALVGMGALFAGIIRAPMTSVFMIFEITQDYQIFVPLMVANLLSFLISRHYQPVPIYHAVLAQDGVHLPGAHGEQASHVWRARDAMARDPVFVDEHRTLEEVRQIVADSGVRGVLVGTPTALVGVVTNDELEAAAASRSPLDPVNTILSREWLSVFPDETMEITVARFKQSPGILPVVSRAGDRPVEGVITVDGMLAFLAEHPSTARSAEGAPRVDGES